MPQEVTVTVYKYDELNRWAQEHARFWFRHAFAWAKDFTDDYVANEIRDRNMLFHASGRQFQ
jgi:hypothetical protein